MGSGSCRPYPVQLPASASEQQEGAGRLRYRGLSGCSMAMVWGVAVIRYDGGVGLEVVVGGLRTNMDRLRSEV